MENPTCFISYSWENDEHKDWVRVLATELQHKGIETKLDQWDCHLGMDLTKYMETCVRDSDFVLLICTPKFCKKANTGQGGVGYEKNIVTGEIFEGISSSKKFVPILRKGSPIDSLPSYLRSRIFIDFRDDNTFDLNIDELIRHLYNSPKYKRPLLGEKPNLSEDVKKQTIDNLSPSKKPQLATFQHVYNFAYINMSRTSTAAEEFAKLWVEKFGNEDFKDFKESYYFAYINMSRTSTAAEEFAKLWVEKFGNKDFKDFKESYYYAYNNMSRTSTAAEEFAKLWVEKFGNEDFKDFKESYYFAYINMSRTSTAAEEFAKLWVEKFGNKDFKDFKESYYFAYNNMSRTSTAAEEFALDQIK